MYAGNRFLDFFFRFFPFLYISPGLSYRSSRAYEETLRELLFSPGPATIVQSPWKSSLGRAARCLLRRADDILSYCICYAFFQPPPRGFVPIQNVNRENEKNKETLCRISHSPVVITYVGVRETISIAHCSSGRYTYILYTQKVDDFPSLYGSIRIHECFQCVPTYTVYTHVNEPRLPAIGCFFIYIIFFFYDFYL